jgi:hypothetical protein
MAKGKIVDVKPSKDGGWDVGAGPALPFRPHHAVIRVAEAP